MSKRIYPNPEKIVRYEVQEIKDSDTLSGVHYRITDINGDNRISTSYDVYNAQIVCDALNEKDEKIIGIVKSYGRETFTLIENEILRAKAKHGPQNFNSFHEGYAVLLEEVDEVKLEVWKSKHDKELIKKEAIQVAAMAVRIVDELCK